LLYILLVQQLIGWLISSTYRSSGRYKLAAKNSGFLLSLAAGKPFALKRALPAPKANKNFNTFFKAG